jgi:DNA adenine methylase
MAPALLRRAAPGPIVKWVGGKTKLLDALTARAPSGFGRYFEPFLGGGALFFRLQPRAAVLSDRNQALIECYQAVRDEVDDVIDALVRHRARHGREHYYQVREAWNAGMREATSAQRAATFVYLNKTCYNGLWRVNSRGAFNVPMGRYERPAILDAAALRIAAQALRGRELGTRSYEAVLDEARAGDFVYFDPPYVPVGTTSDFTSYTAGRFGLLDQQRLADVFRELAGRGCAVMLSNSDTPIVRRIYAGFRIDQVWCGRAVNSRPDRRGEVAEVIVRNPY